MDTTAAAELGMGVAGEGVGLWDSAEAAGDEDALADEDYGDTGSPLKASHLAGGRWSGGGVSGYGSDSETPDRIPPFGSQGRNASSAYEPSSKRMRSFSGEPPSANSYGSDGVAVGFGGELPDAGSLAFSQVSGTNNRWGYDHGSGQPQGFGPNPRATQFQAGLGFGGGSGAQGGHNGGSGGGSMRGRSSTGSIFFKTKLCARFRAGNCPYDSNCNFAHGMEELRKPPPGWEDFVASQESGGGGGSVSTHAGGSVPNQSQVSGSNSMSEPPKFHRSRPCKKYFADGTCPYGERCNFSHEDPTFPPPRQTRESSDTNATPPSTSGGGGGSTNASGAPVPRPPNWKTRICNKWETTGHCPFGDKCHFAHGAAELQKYGGGSIDSPIFDALYPEVNGTSKAASDALSPVPFALEAQNLIAHQRYSGGFGHGSQHRPNHSNSVGAKLFKAWKGPTEISTVYGDWIEDEECSHDSSISNVRPLSQSSPRLNAYSASRFFQGEQSQLLQQHEQQHNSLVVSKNGHHFSVYKA